MVLAVRLWYPSATFQFPVVFDNRLDVPIAIFLSPDTLLFKVEYPSAILDKPVVFAVRALYPIPKL